MIEEMTGNCEGCDKLNKDSVLQVVRVSLCPEKDTGHTSVAGSFYIL
jgi:hypothetical protein